VWLIACTRAGMYTGWYCHSIALRPTQQSRMLERLSLCHSMCDRRDLNVSRRLRRMLKATALPRVGKAHWLRMRYVQLTHALLVLQGQCTRGRIVMAMRDLLEGWADTEEEHSDVGGYQYRLLNAIDDMQSQIERWAWADWLDNP
jgi:hypothetical protein